MSNRKRRSIDCDGQLAALHRSQAVIEFEADGTIITANETFLSTLGFAIVASEVKHLAEQTAKATEQISSQISESQAMAVSAIDGIADTIKRISEIPVAIASAVEQQSGVTREISVSMQFASQGVAAISGRMEDIAASTQQVDVATRDVREASRALG